MSSLQIDTRSLRALRWRARAPQLMAALVGVILMATGVRAIFASPAAPVTRPVMRADAPDYTAYSFAEGFVRAYLTWDPNEELDARERRLALFLGEGLIASDLGLTPANGVRQSVRWTAVVGVRRQDADTTVTVGAETSGGRVFLAVPVHRDDRGFLGVAAPPALVGAPPGAARLPHPDRAEVTEPDLTAVVKRAIANYLAGNQRNLMADLTPGAVVALPTLRLSVTSADDLMWVQRERRVGLTVVATDERKTQWTLRYELDLVHTDRWYVLSIHTNPTGEGGR